MHAERRSASGFTLLEAMVALIIVALGMLAVSSQLNRFVVAAIFVEDKVLASWIATNKITELSVATQWPELGDREEDVIDYAGRDWHCRIEVSATDVTNLRRVDVSVSFVDAPERVLHTVSGLIEPPPPRNFAPVRGFTPVGGGERG